MYPITLKKLKVRNNAVDSYLPVRNSNNNIDWKIVTGLVLSYALKHRIEAYDFVQFRNDCKADLQDVLEDQEFWSVLEKMYFTNHDIFRVSPLFYCSMHNSLMRKST